MTATQPVSMYAMRVPPGDVMVPALPQFASAMGLRVTMAAIDPSEEVISDAAAHKPRATLKVITVPADMLDNDDEDEDDDDDLDDEDEEANGGPSEKTMKKIRDALAEESDGDSDEEMESEDEAEAQAVLAKLMKSTKGKSKALDEEDDDESDEDDEDLLGGELDECVVCTLDPEKQYQQPLDFTIPAGEHIFFKVSGTHTIHLTGNYVVPLDDPEDDEDDYDLSPDEEDELDGLDDLVNGDSESDELDDLEDPRVMEIDNEDDTVATKPAKKGKNKRPAQSDDDEEISLDDVMAKVFKRDADSPATPAAVSKKTEEPAKKLTKAEKKAAKKQKNNDGAPVDVVKEDTKDKVNGTTPESDKKSVKFAKNLEQGPTPSAPKPATASSTDTKTNDKKPSVSLGIRDVNGVTVDDRKLGTGPAAKKGSRLEMRYIGKLENGKVFDSNKSGKPFSFKVGAGEVIKGWDLGLVGMSAGGERRLTIPASLAYGSKKLPGIPANSKLIFDVKCLAVK